MNIRYLIINKEGKEIFNNLTQEEFLLIKKVATSNSQKTPNGRYRFGVISNVNFHVYALTSDKNYLKSSQKFKTELDVIINSTKVIDEIIESTNTLRNNSTRRLIHNLTTLNAHNIQEIYSLIPQENVSKQMGDQITFVEEIVKNDPKETALTLLKIAKNNAAMKAEFSVFKKLFDCDPDLQKREHNVHKVLMNVFYLFFPDFTDKNVKVTIGDNNNKYIAFFDYESLHVALYHLIENAAKYIKQNTTLTVGINNYEEMSEIIFDMISIEITQSEKTKIFEEGVSGYIATQIGKSGLGIGMSRAKKIIELNSGSIEVRTYPETMENIMGVKFQKNEFIIKLPRNKKISASVNLKSQ